MLLSVHELCTVCTAWRALQASNSISYGQRATQAWKSLDGVRLPHTTTDTTPAFLPGLPPATTSVQNAPCRSLAAPALAQGMVQCTGEGRYFGKYFLPGKLSTYSSTTGSSACWGWGLCRPGVVPALFFVSDQMSPRDFDATIPQSLCSVKYLRKESSIVQCVGSCPFSPRQPTCSAHCTLISIRSSKRLRTPPCTSLVPVIYLGVVCLNQAEELPYYLQAGSLSAMPLHLPHFS
ncbi:hypothetical protein BKA67DRAFT_234225 [Truncatella angustata]|uniref:Uncharacterized protein n=1 Tax=Truncatella angustata TaxID=152316 RepID=A0A9P8ZXV8_9PEZI|nr:uncharacterized protein BKA67DRAFT_234225 [Truncatella angustata]KAH6655341.1 hypothetical protein BKA67DRAFT_234225 [Truncatella angustata]